MTSLQYILHIESLCLKNIFKKWKTEQRLAKIRVQIMETDGNYVSKGFLSRQNLFEKSLSSEITGSKPASSKAWFSSFTLSLM